MATVQQLRSKQLARSRSSDIGTTSLQQKIAKQKQVRSLQLEREQQRKVEEAQKKLSGLSYEKYFEEYESLPSDVKTYFTSPEEIRQTSEYKTYQSQIESQRKAIETSQRDAMEWEAAQKIVTKGSRYDPKSAIGRKVNYIYEHGGKVAIYGSASVKQPAFSGTIMTEYGGVSTAYPEQYKTPTQPVVQTISFDKLGQPMSSAIGFPSTLIQQQTTKDIFKQQTSPYPTVNQETQRYQDLGYTKSQAEKIAKESVKQGGMSFSPETSERIIKGETYAQIQQTGAKKNEKVIKGSSVGAGIITGLVSASSNRLDRTNIGMDGGSSNRNTNGNWISNIISRNKENYQKQIEKEIYDPVLGAYVSASPTGVSATGIITPPTKEEQEAIEELTPSQKKIFGVETKSESLFIAPLSKISAQSQEVRELENYFDTNQKYINEMGVWTGSQKDLDKYNANVEKYQELATIKAGFGYGVLQREVPITRFDFERRPIRSTTEVLGAGMGSIGGGIGEVYAGKVGRKVGEFAGEISPYFIPYAGQALFVGEATEYGAIALRTKTQTGTLTPELRREGLFLGGALLTAGAIRGGSRLIRGSGRLSVGEAKRLQSSLTKLDQQPIKYVQAIDETTGRVRLKAFREAEGFYQEIDIAGKIRQTEKGFKFIPEAKGTAKTFGRFGSKEYIGLDVFKTGSKGISIPYRNIGKIKWFKTIESSGFQPLASTSIVKNVRGLFNLQTERSLLRQARKNIRLGGTPIKDISSGNLFRLKENLLLGAKKDREIGFTIIGKTKEVKGIKVLKGGGKKTPFAKTFGEVDLSIQKPKINLDIIKKGLTPPTITGKPTTEIFPSVSASVYTGSGLYERTEEYGVIAPLKTPSITQASKVELMDKKQEEIQITKTQQRETIKFRERTKLDSKNMLLEKPKEIMKEQNVERIKQSPKERISPSQKIDQTLQQGELLKAGQPQKARQKPPITRIPKIPLGLRLLGKERQKTQPDTLYEEFKVFGKRYGKDILVSKTKDVKKAREEFLKFAKGGLGASGFVEVGGRRLSIQELGLDSEFRPSKIERGRIVQKAKYRLGTFAERKEIKSAKKKKSKKVKWI